MRKEKDSLGSINVPEDKYWGAETQRSMIHFSHGSDLIPKPLIIALGIVKKAACLANCELGVLDKKRAKMIEAACDDVIAGKLFDHFPLRVWQTGSGSQSNMNMNEVIANIANERLGAALGSKEPIHPNDHVNRSQSSNDVFPTAMHIATVLEICDHLVPSLKKMRAALEAKRRAFKDVIKIGRTHLMDATPITLGQELSAYVSQIDANINRLLFAVNELLALPLGGTAVGTGLSSPKGFDKKAVRLIAKFTKKSFRCAENKFSLIAAHDSLVFTSGILKTLACSLMKIANDLRWMGSGPNCGLAELFLPANEPGSSIMPGKVNPTQCEAQIMICAQVMGADSAITYGGSLGNFELNVFKPMMIFNLLHSIRLLCDSCYHMTEHLIKGIKVNKKRLKFYVEHSLMLATALSPILGYDKTVQVVRLAQEKGLSIKEATLRLGYLSEKELAKHLNARQMLHPYSNLEHL